MNAALPALPALRTFDQEAFAPHPAMPTGDRVCDTCGKPRTAQHYQRGRQTCTVCRSKSREARQVMKLRSALADAASKRIVAAARGDRLDVPRISQMGAEMFKLFGGMEEFCKLWKEQIDAAIERMPGSKTVMDEIHAITKLAQLANAGIDGGSGGDYRHLSDEDLEAEINTRVLQLVGSEELSIPDLTLDAESQADGDDCA